MTLLKKINWKIAVTLIVLAGAGAGFLAFGPPQLMARTETTLFCSSCHAMQSQFEAWFNVGAHRSIRCVDCHLPHENLPVYYVWKSIDGMKDVVVFYSGQTPENIVLSDRGKRFVQANCIRCHSERVAMINQERECWACHRFLQHRLAGVRLTN
ncbi:MAG: cytochrome c nitrite reductase small subunit [Desulfobacteraceae bacterium]|nr:MAG: cytochrome c nitrite reductase small subunit [Desulfobacteraceae bacterium]